MCQLPKALAPHCHRRQVLVSLILRVEKIEAPATLIYVNPQVLGPKSPPASEVMPDAEGCRKAGVYLGVVMRVRNNVRQALTMIIVQL